MHTVNILTLHCANNYGAVLQAYGLSEAIRRLGHSATIIDYRPLGERIQYGYNNRYSNWIRHPRTQLYTKIIQLKFDRFRKVHLPLSRTYYSLGDLMQFPPDSDIVVCGSDQIWNIGLGGGFDPAFFLSFLKGPHPKRISYAATFGYTSNLNGYQERISKLLSRFDRISVRDIDSKDMVKKLTGYTAYHVLDPSFLIDYESITPPRIFKQPYIIMFCYHQSRDNTARDAIHVMQNYFNIPVISIGSAIASEKIVKPGPTQWLSLMRHAEFICTNSFHGVCFSLINHKQFMVIPNKGRMSRIEDLLQTTGLIHRITYNPNGFLKILRNKIDYSNVSLRINKARNKSLQYLKNSLL